MRLVVGFFKDQQSKEKSIKQGCLYYNMKLEMIWKNYYECTK